MTYYYIFSFDLTENGMAIVGLIPTRGDESFSFVHSGKERKYGIDFRISTGNVSKMGSACRNTGVFLPARYVRDTM